MVNKKEFYNYSIALALIWLIGSIAYSNTFNGSFCLDDLYVIVNNRITHNLHYFTNISDARQFDEFFEYETFKKRYIGYLTFALNYKLHGLDVTGYHIVNLLVHLSNASIIYFLLIAIFRSPLLKQSSLEARSGQIALISSLLFVCHPIQTQAVTYIWQRVTSLAALFYLLSLFMYVKARLESKGLEHSLFPGKSLYFYSGSLVSAVLAMTTKEISFTLPIIVGLCEIMFFNGKFKRRLLYLIPFFCMILIIPLIIIDINKPIGDILSDITETVRDDQTVSRGDYLLTQFRVLMTYIRLVFLPINQNLDYDFPLYGNFFNSEVFFSFLTLLILFSSAVYLFYRYRNTITHTRLISFGTFWFFVTLAPESSIIPIRDVINEHRMYLPSVGFFIALCVCVFILIEKANKQSKNIGKISALVFTVIIILLTGATYERNKVWKTQKSLWEDVVSKSPDKARGHYEIGVVYRDNGLIKKAMEHFEQAIKLDPFWAKPRYNLGRIFQDEGLIDKAIQHYEFAIQLKPDFIEAHTNLGSAYLAQGLIDKAIAHYKISIRLEPGSANAYNNLGFVYMSKGLLDQAINNSRIALEFNPGHSKALKNLRMATAMKAYSGSQKNQ